MADEESDAKKGGGKKKKLIAIVAVLILAAGGYMFLGRGKGEATPAAPPKPEKGAVTKLDPIYLNLAEGRYLKLGIALQASKTVTSTEPMDGAEALDAAIKIFSGKTVKDLSNTKTRTEAQDQLVAAVQKAMGKDVILDVYFTEFVMQ